MGIGLVGGGLRFGCLRVGFLEWRVLEWGSDGEGWGIDQDVCQEMSRYRCKRIEHYKSHFIS